MHGIIQSCLGTALLLAYLGFTCGASAAIISTSTRLFITQQGDPTFFESDTGDFFLDETFTTPISEYRYSTAAFGGGPTGLRSGLSLEVSVDQSNAPGASWQSVEVEATQTTLMQDLLTVMGVSPTTPGGLIQFNWSVSGQSDIGVDASGPNIVGVDSAQTVAQLRMLSAPFLDGPVLLNTLPGNLTLSDSNIDVQLPFAAIPIVHFIPWGVGTVPILYQFESRATLSVRNLDAAGFAAAIEADFSRTATLESVRVLDAAGGVIAGAFVVGEDGFNYSTGALDPAPLPVPVPASWLLVLAGGAGLLAERLSRRGASRRQRSASRHGPGRLGHRMTQFGTMATTTPTSQGMEPGCGSVDQPEIRRAGDDLRRRAVAGE